MPTDEEIAAAKAAEDAAAKEAAEKEATEAKELGLGDAGKKALDAERLRAKNAEKIAADHAKELEALRKEKADAQAAKAKADEEEATKKGEFESLATKRKDEADAAKADAEAKGKELERAHAFLAGVIADRIKALQDTGDKALSDAFPKDADVLVQWEWLADPRTVAAMAAAAEGKKVTDANGRPKVPMTPKPNGELNGTEAELQKARQSGKYAPI